MQRVTDAINGGYLFAVQGQLPLGKAEGLIQKLQRRYPGLARDRKFAYRQRKAERARHKLVCYVNRSEAQMLFVLLTDKPDNQEPWAPVTERESRVRFYEYEAVRTTKPDAGEVWTWQISSEVFDLRLRLMREVIRKRQLAGLQHLIDRTRTWPGFHRVRVQREHLRTAVTGEWRRTMPKGAAPLTWPPLRYVPRLKTR